MLAQEVAQPALRLVTGQTDEGSAIAATMRRAWREERSPRSSRDDRQGSAEAGRLHRAQGLEPVGHAAWRAMAEIRRAFEARRSGL